MNKPTTVTELFDYLDRHPWLRDVHAAGQPVFKVRLDRDQRMFYHGKTLTYTSLSPNGACGHIEMCFDDAGFTVKTTVTREMINEHRYLYETGPEGSCPTPTRASTPAGT